ncbi:unnamed protein product [Staurois parvus]|uniref:Uncharacterized protein n=1 Tax=Staurois parvus TaxID=386267 RepID=A0ABN9ANY7_9NEOB|nr:unnamed protein product [Staurois parvus]
MMKHPYVYDLHLFLGRPLCLPTLSNQEAHGDGVPQRLIDEDALPITDHERALEQQSLHRNQFGSTSLVLVSPCWRRNSSLSRAHSKNTRFSITEKSEHS